MNDEAVNNLVELAKEMSKNDPIDFGNLTIKEDEVYQLMASSVLDQLSKADNPEISLTVSVVHLLVENFALNLKLNGGLDYQL